MGKNVNEMSSDELIEQLEGREDLWSLIDGTPTETTPPQKEETGEATDTNKKEDQSDGGKGQEEESAKTDDKSDQQSDDKDKSSKSTKMDKYMGKVKEKLDAKDNIITQRDQKISELESEIERLKGSDEFDSVDDKEKAISNAEFNLNYEKKRSEEDRQEKATLNAETLNELMDEKDILPEEQEKIRALSENPKYSWLNPMELIAIHEANTGGLKIDQQEQNKKQWMPSILGDDVGNHWTKSLDTSKMDSEQLQSVLEGKIASGDNSFLHH